VQKYNVYLFDFDYTIANAEASILNCYRTVILRHGYADVEDELIKRSIGRGVADIFRTLTGETDAALLEQYRSEFIAEADLSMADNTFLYPHVIPTLRKLKSFGAETGIVSNKISRRIWQTLMYYCIEDLIDVVIGSEDMSELKPSPAGIYTAIEMLGSVRDNVMYIGDSIIDAKTAENAGVAFTAVTTGATAAEEFDGFQKVGVIRNLSELVF